MSNIKITRDPFGECIYIEGVAYHVDFFKFMAQSRPWETGARFQFSLKNTQQGIPTVTAYNPEDRIIKKRDWQEAVAERPRLRVDDQILRRLSGMSLGEVAVDESVPLPAPQMDGQESARRDDTAIAGGIAEAAAEPIPVGPPYDSPANMRSVRWVNPEPLPEDHEAF